MNVFITISSLLLKIELQISLEIQMYIKQLFVICKVTRKILHCINIKIAKYIQGGKVFQLIGKALVAKFSVVCRTSATEQTIYKDGNMCFANFVNN